MNLSFHSGNISDSKILIKDIENDIKNERNRKYEKTECILGDSGYDTFSFFIFSISLIFNIVLNVFD